MELMEKFLEGQKEFILDFFALINVILLFFAYVLGVGVSFVLFKFFVKSKEPENRKTYWVDSELTNKAENTYLKQF